MYVIMEVVRYIESSEDVNYVYFKALMCQFLAYCE